MSRAIAQRNAVEAILEPILSKPGIRDAFDARGEASRRVLGPPHTISCVHFTD